MRAVVQKWGNSLALRIPKPFALASKIEQGTVVEIELVDGKLVATPVPHWRSELARLMAGVTEENRHEETDWGPPVGDEVW